jgi:hypothetical protein
MRIPEPALRLAPLLVCGLGMTAQAVPQSGLLAWYPFDGNGQDLSGNGHHAVTHELAWEPGMDGLAARFDGNVSYAELGVPLSGTNWTICGWAWIDEVNPGWTDWQNVVSSVASSFAIGINNSGGGHLSLWINGTTALATTPVPIRTPFFFLFEREGTAYRIWQDGQQVAGATGNFTPSLLSVAGQWMAGAPSAFDREPLDGWLDVLCVYNRNLTLEERNELRLLPPLYAPPALDITRQEDGQLLLSWGAVAGATGYSLYSASGPAGPWQLVLNTAATTCNQPAALESTTLFRVTATR